MAGMFDMFNTDDPARASEMALIAGLLGGKGSFNSILGRSMMGAQEAGQSAKQRQQAAKLSQLQLEDIQRKAEEQKRQQTQAEAWRNSLVSPQTEATQSALAGGGGPTLANAANMRPVDPQRQMLYDMARSGVAGPVDFLRGNEGIATREDRQAESRESRDANIQAALARAREAQAAALERQREGKAADLERAREQQTFLAANRQPRAEPAPAYQTILSPEDPSKALVVDGRVYRGGGMGAPGVLGYAPKGPLGKKEQNAEDAKEGLAGLVDDLRASYDTLEKTGDVTSTKKGAFANAGAWAKSTGIGQLGGKIVGSAAQSERNKILSARPALINAIKNATGMSAQQMNSNVELKLMLDSATDPNLDVEANRAALDRLERDYIKGGKGGTGVQPGKAKLTAAEQAELEQLRSRFRK